MGVKIPLVLAHSMYGNKLLIEVFETKVINLLVLLCSRYKFSLLQMFVYEDYGSAGFAINVVLLTVVGFLVNGPYALITTAVSADLGTHHSLEGNAKALATVSAIIDGTGSIGLYYTHVPFWVVVLHSYLHYWICNVNIAVESKSMSTDCHRSYQYLRACTHTHTHESRLVCTFTWLYA